MLSQEILNLLVCPVSKQVLSVATAEDLVKIEDLRTRGILKTVTGGNCNNKIEALLISADRKLGYVIRDGIPVLLADEAITLDENF